MVNEITDSTFQQEVLDSDLPVIVDFWAEWCGPCKMLAPIIEELSQELEGKVKIVKINIDNNPNTPSKFGIRSIPTLLFFENGQKTDHKTGMLPKNSIKEWIHSLIDIK